MAISKDVFMLCDKTIEEEAREKYFNNSYWQANIKFDGERILAIVFEGDVLLMNRNGKICNFHFKEVVEDLKKIKTDCIIDGEIISLTDEFEKLQQRALTKTPAKIRELEAEVPVKYMIFDVLKIGSDDIRGLSLNERLKRLKELCVNLEHGEIAEYLGVEEMFDKARKEKREGIVIKNINSTYEGRRSQNWLKLKFFKETVLTVTKYTPNPKGIRVEDEDGNAVQIAGEQSKEVKELLDNFGKAEINIQYLTKTKENRFRFPSYRGLVI